MSRRSFIIFACTCAIMILATVIEGSPLAAQKKYKGQTTPVLPGKIYGPLPEPSPRPANPGVGTMTQRRSEANVKPARQMPSRSKSAIQRPSYLLKTHKKNVPKAVVRPRTDLMYYGMLEDSQRYDPRPNPRLAGVPNPQSSDLTHDHFQELDRNQDGMIDPVERAFGRIDMDRDLHTRTLK